MLETHKLLHFPNGIRLAACLFFLCGNMSLKTKLIFDFNSPSHFFVYIERIRIFHFLIPVNNNSLEFVAINKRLLNKRLVRDFFQKQKA